MSRRGGRAGWRGILSRPLAWYLLLLVASNAWRVLAPADGPVPPPLESAQVPVPADGSTARVAYLDVGPPSAPAVVLLHGSPTLGSFDMLVPSLADDYRVIVPDLPGFGASSLRVPDYSIAAHAGYVLGLLDLLDVSRAHLVGYSMGSGVAIELYRQAPARVASATLLSGIGVQELELFGDYRLNRALHLLQYGLLTVMEWGLPHFGYLDDAALNTTYARNFLDTDQRPLRGVLESFGPPMLILHGRDDALVPIAAAREHHRIVPHSELVELDGGHGLVFRRPALPGGLVHGFVTRVERGEAPTRAQADEARLARAAQPFDWSAARRMAGVGLIVMLVLLALATYVTEDLTCIAAGLLVAQGVLPFWPATIACTIGIYTGDALLFWAGRNLGRPVMQRAPMRWLVGATRIDAARTWFGRYGPRAIIASRFVPGTRLATYLAAGVLGTSFWRFSGYFLIAAVMWTPLLVGAAALLGTAAREYFGQFQAYALPVLAGVALALFVVLRVALPLATDHGRRILLGRWRRLGARVHAMKRGRKPWT